VKSGANLKIVSKFMGHSRIETTARYLHFTENDMWREYKKHI
jgi:site-specific recombinase XerD